MRAYSNKKPERDYDLIKHGSIAEIIFYDNINEEEEGYSYDEERLCVPYRENLPKSIEKNRAAWLKMAQTPRKKKLTPNEEIALLKRENALMAEALTQLILEVM